MGFTVRKRWWLQASNQYRQSC